MKSKQGYSLYELSKLLKGKLINAEEDIIIHHIGSPEKASKNEIVVIKDSKWIEAAVQSQASALVYEKEIPNYSNPQIIVDNTKEAFILLLEIFSKKQLPQYGISKNSYIAPSAVLKDSIYIGENCYIGENVSIQKGSYIYPNTVVYSDTKIGEACILYPNVVLYSNTILKDRVIIHSGTVVGSDGFGYEQKGNNHLKIHQIGGVIIEEDVEIGSNCSIDRATIDYTIIGKGTKIDNLVQIAHNVKIGDNCIIVSQTGIAGSSTIGNNVILAGQVGITDHTKIGNNVIMGARAATNKDITKPGLYIGAPCREFKEEARIWALLSKLPDLFRRVKKLEDKSL